MTESVPRQVGLIGDGAHSATASRPNARRSQLAEASMDIAFGSIAGMISKIFEYPFDTVKVRLQSQTEQSAMHYTGPVDCLRKSFNMDGLAGLYRGLSAPLVGAALENSSLFFSYRLSQKAFRTFSMSELEESLSLTALIFCGAASGAFTSLVLTPVELVKCQMQVPGNMANHSQTSPLSVISLVYKNHGLKGFWHGQLGTLIRETGGSAAWFGSYEAAVSIFRDRNGAATGALPIWQQLVAGASAGICYNFVFYPADTIKSRMQTENLPKSSELRTTRRSFVDTSKEIWRHHGLKGLYRGCGITVVRSAPSSAMIFTVYEWLKDFFT